jgi:predicted DNA-binding transcriptional regulator AlpA
LAGEDKLDGIGGCFFSCHAISAPAVITTKYYYIQSVTTQWRRFVDKKRISGPNIKKYVRLNELAERYGYSCRQTIRLVKTGILPQPMSLGAAKVWPIEVLEEIDKQREDTYREQLKKQGFLIPKASSL